MCGSEERSVQLGHEYGVDFYSNQQAGSHRSAQRLVPWLCDLLRPKSVLDVGCGVGTWLRAFKETGIEDFLGLDGEYVRRDQLQIPAAQFLAQDLTLPFRLDRKFDLVVSLEVAEHLPPEAARGFVASLCAHAPFVLFSAAIPGQGGTHHVNEQWPGYWIDLFADCSFALHDCIRPMLWTDDEVEFWYAQNALLFRKADLPLPLGMVTLPSFQGMPLAHPRAWAEKTAPRAVSWRQIAGDIRERLKRVLQPQGD
ncbi:MAG: class I SAM-dependent methyltransferase [Acidobacteriota bacterium]